MDSQDNRWNELEEMFPLLDLSDMRTLVDDYLFSNTKSKEWAIEILTQEIKWNELVEILEWFRSL